VARYAKLKMRLVLARPETVQINVSNIMAPNQLHQLLFDELKFLHYYGGNWDAFWDVITAEEVLPAKLIIWGWKELEATLPREAKLMQECLTDYKVKCPDMPCEVIYA